MGIGEYVGGCLGDGWGECEGQWGRVRVRIGAIVSDGDGEAERVIVRVSGAEGGGAEGVKVCG